MPQQHVCLLPIYIAVSKEYLINRRIILHTHLVSAFHWRQRLKLSSSFINFLGELWKKTNGCIFEIYYIFSLPRLLQRFPRFVLNTAARSIAGLRRSARITDTLTSFHWLRASERIQFKLAVIVYLYRALHGIALQYLSHLLRRVADIPTASSLSATAHFLLWNSLPNDITSAPSLPVFRRQLTTYLFQRSYPAGHCYCAIVVAVRAVSSHCSIGFVTVDCCLIPISLLLHTLAHEDVCSALHGRLQ